MNKTSVTFIITNKDFFFNKLSYLTTLINILPAVYHMK